MQLSLNRSRSFARFHSWLIPTHSAAALILVLAIDAPAQTSSLVFDPHGNLAAEVSEIPAAPQILGQPQNQVTVPAQSASFSVMVADTRGLSYQWRFNGSDLPGQTGDSLLVTNVSAANEGAYSVLVANASNSVLSAPAILFIDADGNGLPDAWELTYFGKLGQTALGDFDGDGVSNLQEFLDGTVPTDPASALYHLTVITGGGTVVVVPDQRAYANGTTVTLTAVATGTEPFHGWTGDVLARTNTITVAMNTNKTVSAWFGPIPFTWTNAAGGDWDTASNWSPNIVPGPNDSVVIPLSATVTLNRDAECADVTIGGGGISPTLTGTGTLTVRGTLLWSSGACSGSGRTIVETGGVFVMDAPATGLVNARTFELGGTTFWTGTGDVNSNGAVITNRPGADFEAQSAGSFRGVSRFDNAGIFHKSTGNTNSFSNTAVFNNYNIVQIQSGTLVLGGGGTNTGSLTIEAGATLELGAGSFNSFNSGPTSAILGGGQFTFSGGTASFAGDWRCTNNTFAFSGGTANFDGIGTVAPSVVNLNDGALGGAQTVTVQNLMNWTGGSQIGSGRTVIPSGAILNLGGLNSLTLTTRTLENGGTATWTSPGPIAVNDGVITNRAGAVFTAQTTAPILFTGGAPRFDNAGTFRTAVAGATSIGPSLNNFGLVDIQAGMLTLLGGGTNAGTISVSDGATINFRQGAFGAGAASLLSGGGSLQFNGASATLAGTVALAGPHFFTNGIVNITGNYTCTNAMSIAGATVSFNGTGLVAPSTLTQTDGTLDGAQTVTVGSLMNWTGGTMTGGGRTIISPGATLNAAVPSFASLSLSTRTLENGGTSIWTGSGIITLSAAVITNRPGALFDIQNASVILSRGGSPRFDNAGTCRKSISTGPSIVNYGVTFANYGTVDIRAGTLAANGGYISSSNALLNCALGGTTAGTNYGQLQVAGTVALNGALSVDLVNGFLPSSIDSFMVVTAGTRGGTFANFLYPSNVVTMELSYTSNSVAVLAVPGALPERVLAPPQISGTNITLCWGALPNVTYRVEVNSTLDPSIWIALPGDVTGSGGIACKTDTLTATTRFYRIVALP